VEIKKKPAFKCRKAKWQSRPYFWQPVKSFIPRGHRLSEGQRIPEMCYTGTNGHQVSFFIYC